MRRALLLLLAAPLAAEAHEVGLSYGVYTAAGAGLDVELTFAEKELAVVAEGMDVDGDGKLSELEVRSATAALSRVILGGVEVRAGEAVCAWTYRGAALVEADGVALKARSECPGAAANYSVSLGFLGVATPGHRHLVRVVGGEGPPVELVTHKAAPSFTVGGAQESTSFGAMLVIGVEHILLGLDHLLFLLGLVLVGGRVRAIVAVITAFTVAHSITIAVAVLGIWTPSGRVIEPLIALSIAYVAIENWFVADANKRWPLTLAFGLVHGFGFAGALGELRVPKEDVPSLLLAFNLGVEIGQLLVLAIVLPILFKLRKSEAFRTKGVRAISAVLAAFGVFWFVERILGA